MRPRRGKRFFSSLLGGTPTLNSTNNALFSIDFTGASTTNLINFLAAIFSGALIGHGDTKPAQQTAQEFIDSWGDTKGIINSDFVILSNSAEAQLISQGYYVAPSGATYSSIAALFANSLISQGCSTLQMNHLRQRLEAAKSGAISILTECACSIGLEDIEPEAAESGEHARVAPYT
jgi:hypothetical protein